MNPHPFPPQATDDPSATPVRLPEKERGSALIVSMMIMVILTMLGVTFAVLAAQEERISVNARDHEQTLYVAEAALEVARTWFNDPDPGTNPFKPTSGQMNYSLRKGMVFRDDWRNPDELGASDSDTDPEVDGSAGAIYTGGNLGGGSSRFDKPYRGTYGNSFWGRQATPDVLLCGDSTLNLDGDATTTDCTTPMKNYMDRLNGSLAMALNLRNAGHSARDAGTVEIEQIRVYRPPIDFDLFSRYGIATIEATAIKRVRNQIVARRTVREVLQEIPFPGPSGAIESEGEISAAGSSGVHWGSVVSSATDDDIRLRAQGNNFPDAAVARSTSARWGFHASINPASGGNYGGQGGAVASWLTEALGITWQGVRQNFAVGNANFKAPTIGDPWLIFRARRRILVGGTDPLPAGVQPHPWNARTPDFSVVGNNARDFVKNNKSNWSHMFQSQIVRFPPMDYQTWKDVSQSASQGMYYLKWDGSGGANSVNYRRDGIGASQSWTTWLSQLQRGVFFFDTKDSSKPLPDQSNLTGTHGWGTNLYVEGFVYLNAATFDSSGAGNGTTKACNMPGEVFLDDGIDLHAAGETVGDDCLCIRFDADRGCVLGVRPIGWPGCTGVDGDDCTCPESVMDTLRSTASRWAENRREADTFRNGLWDSDINNDGISDANDDITTLTGWSNFISNNTGGGQGFNGGHGYAKGVLPGYPFANHHQQGMTIGGVPAWQRDPRFLNQVAAAPINSTVGRQVHEPFLNFDSPSEGNTIATWSGNDHAVKVDYQHANDPVVVSGGTATKLTTRARDATGALMNLDLHINGVFYCEGVYTGTGNLKVYGSLLMRGGYSGTGSVDVWFNEDLVKGNFPDKTWKLPRVYASARDTN